MSAAFLYKDERIADVLPGCHLHTTSLYGINSFLKDNGFYRMTEYSAKLIVTVTGVSKVSATLKGLAAKHKYYVRVRVFKTVGGTKYYSTWSPAKSSKTK